MKMVSTRGVKFKFSEGEKVLCYEPDPSKAKVLYDSKVLGIVPKGRKSVEYLIHFQGWSSSWDRCVPEEFVLRDTPENRQLQRRLADKAQLQLGVFFYRKDRCQQPRRSKSGQSQSESGNEMDENTMELSLDEDEDDIIKQEEEDELPLDDVDDISDEMDEMGEDDAIDDLDEEIDSGTPTGGASSEPGGEQYRGDHEPCTVPLDMPPELKSFLDEDWRLVNIKKMNVRLPANPTVHAILEAYVKDYACVLLTVDDYSKGDSDQESMRSRQHSSNRMSRPRKRQRRVSNSSSDGEETDKELDLIDFNLRTAKYIVDGLKNYIDFVLGEQLLYMPEKAQYGSVCGLLKRHQMGEMRLRFNPPAFPVHKRLLGRLDSDSEECKSDTEAELLQMISVMDESFAQRWNELLRDAGCETDPESDMKPDNDVEEILVTNPGSTSGAQDLVSPSCSHNSELGSGSKSRGAVPTPPPSGIQNSRRKHILDETLAWKIVPDAYLQANDTTLSQVYGAIHIARLMARLPVFLYHTKFPGQAHVRMVQKHLNLFINFLSKQKAWFGDQHYYSTEPDSDSD